VEKSTEVLDVGLARLRDAVDGAGADADVEALCERVIADLVGVEGAQTDDVTMIALRALARLDGRAGPDAVGDPGVFSATDAGSAEAVCWS
jgi:hypothetical protein